MPIRLKVVQWLSLSVVPILVFLLILVSQPFYGNMDDSSFLVQSARLDPISFAHYWGWNPSNGYVKDFSVVLTWPSYALGNVFGPSGLYLANAFITYSIVVVCSLLLKNAFAWKGPWPVVGAVGVSFLWPFTAELLFFPSLFEKGVLLGAALLFSWSYLLREFHRSWLVWAAFILITAAAFSSKASILVYVPAAIAMLWVNFLAAKQNRHLVFPVVATFVWIGLSFVILYMTLNGSYTSNTQGQRNFSFLSDYRFIFVLSLGMLYCCFLVWFRYARKEWQFNAVVPLIALVSLMISFALWGVQNYYLGAFSLTAAMSFGVFIDAIEKPSWKVFLALTSIVLACVWCTIRLPGMWEIQGSVREFLESESSMSLANEGEVVAVSCAEAPVHFNRYARDMDRSGIEFVTYESDQFTRYYFADSKLCPIQLQDLTGWEEIWAGANQNSYKLYKRIS